MLWETLPLGDVAEEFPPTSVGSILFVAVASLVLSVGSFYEAGMQLRWRDNVGSATEAATRMCNVGAMRDA